MQPKPRPDEVNIFGARLDKHGNVSRDPEAGRRMSYLLNSYLVKVATDETGWRTLYRDPEDGRFWEMTFPYSHFQGGGPHLLTAVDLDLVRERYGSDVP